jgi:hypothetical protein
VLRDALALEMWFDDTYREGGRFLIERGGQTREIVPRDEIERLWERERALLSEKAELVDALERISGHSNVGSDVWEIANAALQTGAGSDG